MSDLYPIAYYENVRDVRYANADGSKINMRLMLYALGEDVPYTADPNDVVVVSRELYERAVAGDFGAIADYVAPSPSVPLAVTPLQARRALRAAGLLATVNSWVANQDDDDIRDAWDYAQTIERNGPITLGAAQALGLTDAQLDALFISAATFV